ncbi:glycosyltransferase family 2 protein [Lysobacter sp. A289]
MNGVYAPVSVIIPCYQCKDTIHRAVASVVSQSLVPAEIIMVEDCSGDGTSEVLRDLQRQYSIGWIKIIVLEINSGPGTARNVGWNASRQPYIAFLDSDDHWHADKLKFQLTWMEVRPDVALSCHDWPDYHDGPDRDVDIAQYAFLDIVKRRLLISNRIYTSTVMVRRDLPQRFPEFRRYSEDYHLWLNICLDDGRCVKSFAPLAYRHKPTFGAVGLSGQLWRMELGELSNFRMLYAARKIGLISLIIYSAVSIVKFARRLAISSLRRVTGRV